MNKEERREYMKLYYQKNKEKHTEYMKQYRQENTDKIREQKKQYNKEYLKTPMARAQRLVQTYKREDKKHNRGECTLTAKWVVENIFTQKCAHCDKEGWQIIGCNRLDNSRPHTEDNVEPCCKECNDELHSVECSKKVYQYTLAGELVKVWHSTMECGRNGFNHGNVAACCNGNLKTHKGFQWSYEPI